MSQGVSAHTDPLLWVKIFVLFTPGVPDLFAQAYFSLCSCLTASGEVLGVRQFFVDGIVGKLVRNWLVLVRKLIGDRFREQNDRISNLLSR